jgi:NAD-dependent SIR2 family protein deacetylase
MSAELAAPRVGDLVALLRGRSIAVLTGAGISTESGIPDYRGPGTRARAKDPMRFAEYTASGVGRARYWVRAMVGWPSFAAARPNAGHRALAGLEDRGLVRGVVTQNVDRLHHAAGSRRIVELHGALHEVRCLDCGAIEPRAEVQARLDELNPHVRTAIAERVRPDGDADLPAHWIEGFRIPACRACGGTIKPDVVFFGESVPAPKVEAAYATIAEADVLLVVGSSLTVFSGYRFVRRAAERGMPIAIVNLGDTRGDPYATVRVDGPAGAVLTTLAAALAS